MFSPSDYNDAVPQFTNGTYANTPLNPLYVEEPTALDYNRGVEPVQTLPAQWWNWLCGQFTSKLNKLNIYVKNIFDELTQLLSLVGVTPDATEEAITTGQLKDAFETKYPAYLNNNFSFESVLQGRTRGVLIPPTDTWYNATNTLSLSNGFGVLNTNKKVLFVSNALVLPNDGNVHYIVSSEEGVLSIEDTIEDDVILVGLCYDKEYCLLVDNDVTQCKENIILKKWFGQSKITQGFVPVLQSYYNTSIASIETFVSIDTVSGGSGVNGGTFNNCAISISTVGSGYGIYNGTFNDCAISISTVNGGYGINNSTFNDCAISINAVSGSGTAGVYKSTCNDCIISINTISSGYEGFSYSTCNNCTISFATISNGTGFDYGAYNNCTISISTISGSGKGFSYGNFNNCTISISTVSGGYGVRYGTFNNCTISISTVSSGSTGVYNGSNVKLYLTHIICTATTDLSSTGGKLNVLNDTVLHAS